MSIFEKIWKPRAQKSRLICDKAFNRLSGHSARQPIEGFQIFCTFTTAEVEERSKKFINPNFLPYKVVMTELIPFLKFREITVGYGSSGFNLPHRIVPWSTVIPKADVRFLISTPINLLDEVWIRKLQTLLDLCRSYESALCTIASVVPPDHDLTTMCLELRSEPRTAFLGRPHIVSWFRTKCPFEDKSWCAKTHKTQDRTDDLTINETEHSTSTPSLRSPSRSYQPPLLTAVNTASYSQLTGNHDRSELAQEHFYS